MVAHVSLGDGSFTFVDDEDAERVKIYDWRLYRDGSAKYAMLTGANPALKISGVLLHRFVLNYCGIKEIDHRDGDGLNNCKDNLRFASRTQNVANRQKSKPTILNPYKGVVVSGGRWKVVCQQQQMGSYICPVAAARAYDAAARAAFGEFACTNFPEGNERPALPLGYEKPTFSAREAAALATQAMVEDHRIAFSHLGEAP